MNQLGINHTKPIGHQPYPSFVMNQLASTILGRRTSTLLGLCNEPAGHQPYLGFAMNQLDINHNGPVGHQPYPGFAMNQLGINHTGSVGH